MGDALSVPFFLSWYLPKSDQDGVYNWPLHRIDCKWWGLWEASGTYPSKINPRTPQPPPRVPQTPSFWVVFLPGTLSSQGHIIFPNHPASKKLPVEQIFWGTDPLGAPVGCSISFKSLPITQLPPNPPREGKTFFFFRGRVLFIGCTSGTWRNRNANPADARWSMSFLAL